MKDKYCKTQNIFKEDLFMAAANFVNGINHVGVPTTDLDATIKFYTDLGFKEIYTTMNGTQKVSFLDCSGVMIEAYTVDKSAMARGGIDHLALGCTDIEACFEEVKKLPYPIVEEITFLPFWENGVKYFLVQGPNMEIIEFIQKL